MKQIISFFSLLVVLVLLMNCNKSAPLPNMQSNPQPANPYTEQGYLMINLKKYDEAISYFNKAIQLGPRKEFSFYGRGRANWYKGQNDEAMADFNKSIELAPNNANAYFFRGAVYMKDEKVDKAIIEFNMAIQINPDFAEAYLYRGTAFEKTGEINRADLDKKRAKELEPRVEAVLKRLVSPEIDQPIDPDTIYTMAEVDFHPKPVNLVAPVIPFEVHGKKFSGYVLLKYVITKEGKTKDITIKESSPKGVFEAASIKAVEQYRFNPAIKNGQAVNVSVLLPITFGTDAK